MDRNQYEGWLMLHIGHTAKGSYEFMPVRPSVLLSFCQRSFLRIDPLVFPETQHDVRGPCGVVRDRARFFWGKKKCPQNGENGPKIGSFEFDVGKFSH